MGGQKLEIMNAKREVGINVRRKVEMEIDTTKVGKESKDER